MDTAAIRTLISVGAGTISGLAVLARYTYRRFKRSGAQEIEPFTRYATQGIKYYLGRYVRRQLAAELTLKQYARLHLKSTAKEMLVPATIPVRLNVDRVFIPLLLRDSLQEHINHSDLLDRRGQRIIILGEPGSGKSSLFKRLFRDACRRAASSPRKAPVPILFELRSLTTSIINNQGFALNDFLELLLSSLRTSAVYHSSKAVEDLSHGAGFFILLDGLDEVPSAFTESIISALTQLSNYLSDTSPQSTVLISSRTQYFFATHNRDVEEIFDVLSIQPFSLGNIYSFLEKWPFAANSKENITRLFSRLRQLPSLTEMCTNPLALSMFVARDQQTGGAEFSETRSRFYENLLEELIVNRRSRGEGLPAGRQRLRDIRRAILGPVCLEHLLNPDEIANSIPRERFIRAIESVGYGGLDPTQVLVELSIDTGLFIEERAGETIRFLHLTLCEFLAAVEVVENGEAGWTKLFTPIRGFGHDVPFWESRLSEIVAFSCGLAGRSLRQRILADLSNYKRSELLLKPIMEAQAYNQPVAAHVIRSECQYILNQAPVSWDVEWFTRLRTILTVLRDASAGKRAELGKSLYELPDGSHLLMDLIERYQAEDRLLGTLARQDADAAIGIAESTNRRDLMDHVAAASDDFTVLQGILGRIEKGIKGWQTALVERALTDQSIARFLNSIQSDNLAAQDNQRTKGKWARAWLTGNSIYGTLLDNVLSDSSSWSVNMHPLFMQLSKIRPAKSFFYSSFRAAWPLACAAMAAFVASIIFIIVPFTHQRNIDTVIPIIAIALALLGLTIIIGGMRDLALFKIRIRRAVIVSIEIEETNKIMIRSPAENPDSVKESRLEESLRGLTTSSVLREILNIRTYRFKQIDSDSEMNIHLSRRTRQVMFLSGVSVKDLRCMMTARAIRRSMVAKVVPGPSPQTPKDIGSTGSAVGCQGD